VPVYEKSPYGTEYNSFAEDGEPIVKVLAPDDLLEQMAKGMTPEELSAHFNAPIPAIEDAIMSIPLMMSWRRTQMTSSSLQKLPEVPIL